MSTEQNASGVAVTVATHLWDYTGGGLDALYAARCCAFCSRHRRP